MAAGVLALRPLSRADFPTVVRWLAEPHVAAWWGPPKDWEAVEKEYGPCVDRTDATEVYIAVDDDAPVGLVQIYRLADNPDYQRAVGVEDGAGVDLLIGEAARCGGGLGPRLIGLALELVWAHYPEVARAMAGPSVQNSRSHRAFAKAGFSAQREVRVPGEDDDELVFVCPRPTTT